MRQYSRLASVEQKKNKRTAIIFAGLSVVLIVFLAFFGLRFLGQVTGFFENVESSNSQVNSDDVTPPAPPRLNYLPEYTNKEELVLEGTSESGSTVVIALNDTTKEVITDAQGLFSATLRLQKGQNNISAKAIDINGNESSETPHSSITFDDEKPAIEVIKPKDGDKFYGNKQRQITVEGKTEADATLTINNRVVVIGSDGVFRFTTNLGEGQNSFNIKSTDQAGNQTELTINVEFTP